MDPVRISVTGRDLERQHTMISSLRRIAGHSMEHPTPAISMPTASFSMNTLPDGSARLAGPGFSGS